MGDFYLMDINSMKAIDFNSRIVIVGGGPVWNVCRAGFRSRGFSQYYHC